MFLNSSNTTGDSCLQFLLVKVAVLLTGTGVVLLYKAYGLLLLCCMICLSLMLMSSQQHIPLTRLGDPQVPS